VLGGWLHATTRNIASQTVRTEVRRRNREQEAAAMKELLAGEPETKWEDIAPWLDAALGELNETERDALVLRYFNRKTAHEMGQLLGISEDAAQKRTLRAVERIRENFVRRGIAVGASVFIALVTANAVQSAPVGLSLAISSTAIAGASSITTTAKIIAMTTLQKTFVTVIITAAIGASIYEAHKASTLAQLVQELREEQVPLTDEIEKLRRQQEDSKKVLASLTDKSGERGGTEEELLRLRAEVTRLRANSTELAKMKSGSNDDPVMAEATSWKNRVTALKQRLADTPSAMIPELQLLKDQDWLSAAKNELKSDKDYRNAFSSLRNLALNRFEGDLHSALTKYLEANQTHFPTEMSQLQPYFKTPVDNAILDHWEIDPAKKIPNLRMGGDYIITQTSAPDPELDLRFGVGSNGYGSSGAFQQKKSPVDAMTAVLNSYLGDSGGQMPSDPGQLLPYIKNDDQRAAVRDVIKRFKIMSDSDKVQMWNEAKQYMDKQAAK
jgi:hypothetical protein